MSKAGVFASKINLRGATILELFGYQSERKHIFIFS